MTLPSDLRAMLDASGVPWQLKQGGRHVKVYVNGRFVAILPNGGTRSSAENPGRAHLNIRAAIKRAIRSKP